MLGCLSVRKMTSWTRCCSYTISSLWPNVNVFKHYMNLWLNQLSSFWHGNVILFYTLWNIIFKVWYWYCNSQIIPFPKILNYSFTCCPSPLQWLLGNLEATQTTFAFKCNIFSPFKLTWKTFLSNNYLLKTHRLRETEFWKVFFGQLANVWHSNLINCWYKMSHSHFNSINKYKGTTMHKQCKIPEINAGFPASLF